MFTRIDNFLAKGFDDEIAAQRERAQQEKAEVDTINATLGKEFPQQEELALVRENHSAVIRELQRMQDDDGYVSEWQPKTILQGSSTEDNIRDVELNENIISQSHKTFETKEIGYYPRVSGH